MIDHPKQRFPKSRDSELGTVQAALLSAAGPLTCPGSIGLAGKQSYQEVFLKNGNSGAAAGKEEITIET